MYMWGGSCACATHRGLVLFSPDINDVNAFGVPRSLFFSNWSLSCAFLHATPPVCSAHPTRLATSVVGVYLPASLVATAHPVHTL